MPNTFDGIINEPTVDFVGKDGFFWWFGEVVYTEDPLQLGRVKVRIMGWYTGLDKNFKTDMPDEDLPWAVVLQPTNQPGVAGSGQSVGQLQQGAMVMGFFLDGQEAQQPVVMGVVRSRKQSGSADAKEGINSLFSDDKYDATANLSLVSSATNTVTGKGNASPQNGPIPTQETQSTADSNLFTANVVGGSSANASVPTIAATTAGNAVAGSVNTFEGTLSRMLQNIAVAGSQVISTGKDSYQSIINGNPVNIKALVGTATNLITSVLSEALAAVKEVFLTTIATGLKALKIAGIFGIPFVVTTAIQLIIQAVLKFLCGLDATWLNGILNALSGTLEQFVNSVVGAAFDSLASIIQSAFDNLINQILCAINGALNAIQSVINAVVAAVSVAKTVADIMKKGTAFFQNLEKINISDLTSITSIISLLLGLIPTQCDRTAPGGNVITSFVPFLGSTTCDVTNANPLGNIVGTCGSFSSPTGGGAAAGVASAANAVEAILQQADAFLTAVENGLDGSEVIRAGTPGRRATIERRASGMSWWSIRSNDQEYRNWKETKDAERSGKRAPSNQKKPNAKDTIFGDTITFPGATQIDVQKDFLLKNIGQFQHNVDGSYKLKVVGDLDIEVGGRLAFKVNGAPQKKSPDGTNNSSAGSQQSKNVIIFDSDTEISSRGKLEVQGMGTTTSSKPGTDVKLMTDNLNFNAPSFNINCTNDLKLCAGNAIYVETPSLIRNINFPPLPRAKSGIFTICHGSYDMILNPCPSGADAVPRFTVNNTVGPISLLVGAGGMFFTVAAGGLTAQVTAGAMALTTAAGAITIQSSAAMTLTAGAIMTLTAATIKLN